MLWPGCRRTFPWPFAFSAISLGFAYPYDPDPTRHSPGIPRRHPPLRPTHGVGRLDRARGYHPYHRFQRRYVRNAEDSRFTESAQEEDRRECRNEWRELLRQHGATADA